MTFTKIEIMRSKSLLQIKTWVLKVPGVDKEAPKRLDTRFMYNTENVKKPWL
jgi:hypothetical protein